MNVSNGMTEKITVWLLHYILVSYPLNNLKLHINIAAILVFLQCNKDTLWRPKYIILFVMEKWHIISYKTYKNMLIFSKEYHLYNSI